MAPALGRMLRSSPYWPVVSDRTLRRALPGFAFSALGHGMAAVGVSWLAIELAPAGSRGAWVAVAVAAYTLPGAAGALLLGRFLRDRDPVRLVRWDASLRAVALGLIPVAYALDALDGPLYVGLLAASSVLHSWGQAGVYTLLARVLPERDHLAGNAVLSTVFSLATVIGPALAGALIAWTGAAVVVIAVDAVAFLVLAIVFRFVSAPEDGPAGGQAERTEEGPVEPGAAPPPRPAGLTIIRNDPALFGVLGLSFGFFFLFGPVYVALPLYVSEDLRGSASLLSGFYTAFGVGAVLGALVSGYLSRWRLWPTVIGIVIGFGIFLLPVGLGAFTPVAMASFALAGLVWPPYSSLSTTLVQRAARGPELAQVLAVNSSVRVVSVPLGTALGGPLVAAFGSGRTLQISAVGILALGIASALALGLRTAGGARSVRPRK
ncbi:MFS transporter [Streptomyces sp. NPDC014894]|uniref:MFS transporter n=1 Tax=Streptomyces sp. NPDC014894 TaxID=3364931 RepID=UPI0036F50F2D